MIVVTGSSGFIGSNLMPALAAAGVEAIGIDRRPPADDRRHGAPTVLVDLSGPSAAAARALAAAHVVIHLAGRPGVRDHGPAADRARRRDNVVATERVLAACAPDTYLVVASSSSVYGGSRDGRPCREEDPLRPSGGYARSKRAAELRCVRRGGPTLVVRPFTVIGQHQRHDMALSRWITAAAGGRPLTLYGDPGRSRDMTDVWDVVRALLVAVERRPTGVVNLGTGVARTLGDVAATVRRVVADVPIEIRPPPVVEPDDTLAHTARCQQLFGFLPCTDLDAVVRRQYAALSAAWPSRPPACVRRSVLDDVLPEPFTREGPRARVPSRW